MFVENREGEGEEEQGRRERRSRGALSTRGLRRGGGGELVAREQPAMALGRYSATKTTTGKVFQVTP